MKKTRAKRERGVRRRLLRAGACCLLASSLLVAPAAAATKQRPPTSLYWGAQIGDQMTGEAAPWDMTPVDRFQSIAGKGLSLIEFGSPFAECDGGHCVMTKFPSTPLENARRYGAIPVFSWNSTSSPPSVDQPDFNLGTLISGRYDSYIRDFATKAREWGKPFFLRFDWEMNGFWFPWSEGVNGNTPGQFVAAWRHVRDIFTQVGATNATWVWCPNVDLFNSLTPLGELYPGDSYVDWTGLDGFNWGRRRGSPGWQSFNQVFHRTYKRIVTRVAPGKPMMLAEVASSDKGGSKSAWIKDMLAKVRHRYRKIRAIVWYDVDDRGTNWPIERNKKAGNAFRKGIRPSAYRPNIFGGITQSPIQPPPR
ncbi:MAG TPA: glycosyl hydrolase [Solirubrobacterales bacterium]|nr:glycosyl hydrolase [Solirubrobacterales bacterium]